jgi:DNA invertase Pin-like site-specific DNA recombinase
MRCEVRAKADGSNLARVAAVGATPCVIYGAKSTEDRRGSIPDQLEDCRAAVEHEPDRALVAEYADEAFSAFTRSRGPGLVDAMDHAERLARDHGISELWAQHSDRLARGDGKSARHAVEIALWALKRDVKVRTVQDPDTFRDLLYAVVTGQRNHEDSRRRGLSIAAGRRRAAARGDYIGYRPDGYLARTEIDDHGAVKKRLVMDPERQPVIEMIFRMALRGCHAGAIAWALNDAGWQTKPFFRGTHAKPWTTGRVGVVLRNARYAGLAVVRGETVGSGHWPAYISPAQHKRLQARRLPPNAGKPVRRRETYLFKGLAVCGHCGSSLCASTGQTRIDGTVDRRYACASHKNDRHAGRCSATGISADLVEAMFVASLRSLLPGGNAEPEPYAATVSPSERERLIDAVLSGDERRTDATLATLIERRDRSTHPGTAGNGLELHRFQMWAEQERLGRTENSREDARILNRTLATWFSRIVITLTQARATIVALPHSTADEPPMQTEVQLDLEDWTRPSPQARWLHRIYGRWTDAEVAGALRAWTETHGRTPTPKDWEMAEIDHPCSKTVVRRFKTWGRAVRQAGLKPAARVDANHRTGPDAAAIA